jgi:hypothetical protein
MNYGSQAAAFTGTGANGRYVNTITRTRRLDFPALRALARVDLFQTRPVRSGFLLIENWRSPAGDRVRRTGRNSPPRGVIQL